MSSTQINLFDLVECPKCGWVHFAVDEEFVVDWEKKWATFWPTLDQSGKEAYGVLAGPPTRKEYLECFFCGSADRSSFFKSQKDVTGHTIQPILIDHILKAVIHETE